MDRDREDGKDADCVRGCPEFGRSRILDRVVYKGYVGGCPNGGRLGVVCSSLGWSHFCLDEGAQLPRDRFSSTASLEANIHTRLSTTDLSISIYIHLRLIILLSRVHPHSQPLHGPVDIISPWDLLWASKKITDCLFPCSRFAQYFASQILKWKVLSHFFLRCIVHEILIERCG